MKLHRIIPLPALLLVATGLSAGEMLEQDISTEYQDIRLIQVASGLEHPWSLAFLPDGRLLVTERPGRLNIIGADGRIERVSGTPEVHVRNQGGLLDVSLHPDFADNGRVYLTYSRADDSGDATTVALGRGQLDGARLTNFEVLFEQDRYSEPGRHYGSRLAWTPDGKLLMSIGDRGADPPRAQDLGDHAGSLLRLNDDGSAPDDNPFVDRDDAQPEIYSYGHRNIQGLIVDTDGAIWATEHGPRGSDELNRIEAGENYGWPAVTLGRDYRTQEQFGDSVRHKAGMVDPVLDITPSLAASGLARVPDDSAFDMWRGDLLAGGLRMQQIRRIHFDNGIPVHQEELLRGEVGRIRDVRIGPDGNIWFISDQPDAGVYRIEP